MLILTFVSVRLQTKHNHKQPVGVGAIGKKVRYIITLFSLFDF